MKNQQQQEQTSIRLDIPQIRQDNQENRERQLNYTEDYNALIGLSEKVGASTLSQELKLYDIQYNELEDHNQFFLQLLHHSKNYRALTVKVILGPFTTVLTIFNNSSQSFIHELNCLFGCCGNVYLLQWGAEEKIAVKCIQMSSSHESIFLRTVKEYTINKIASALQLGPKIIKIHEFDLIIYQKCIEFCMQKCLLAEQYTLSEEDHLTLKKKLRTLHELQIVHCDIKPSNIVYSESYRSPVFLDFGFSRIITTKVGKTVRTKFVGSLESCCKQMVRLYVTKKFGYVDLYYNDAYALDVAIKSDPIRETGNDLEEIIKFCDPSKSNFNYVKIFYSLYHDQIFNATNQLLISRPDDDRKHKIMNCLDMLTPTENLREFYFKFFECEWKDSFLFSEFVRNYTHSHRHQLQLDLKYRNDTKLPESRSDLNIFCKLIQGVFNVRLNLYELDNDLINFEENCIGLKKYYYNEFQTLQEKFDFFLFHVGILNQNYFFAQRQFELPWQIANHFIQTMPQGAKNVENNSQKLLICFQFLTKYCLEPPITIWKIKTFRRTINQQMILKKIDFPHFQKYLVEIINLSCQFQIKMNLLVIVLNSLTYQIAIWGNFMCDQKKSQKQIDLQIEKLQGLYYRLITQESDYEKVIKLDLFLLKNLLKKKNTIDSIVALEKQTFHLKEQVKKQRMNILKFIKIMHHYDLKQYEQCRIEIVKTFAVSQIPIVLKPQYFLLCNVYYYLHNFKRCKQLFTLLEENMMVKNLIFSNQNIAFSKEIISKKNLQILDVRIQTIENLYVYLALIFKKYFHLNNALTRQQKEKFYDIIKTVTKDEELVQSLRRLTEQRCYYLDKVKVYKRILEYYKGAQITFEKQQGEYIKKKYVLPLLFDSYWYSNQFELLIQCFDKGKFGKLSIPPNIQKYPQLFDYLTKAYMMLNRTQKVKMLIKPIQDVYMSKLMLIEKWIGTITFAILFQSILQKSMWTEFRDLLLIIVDFIDIHPTSQYINSYVRCLRYAFSQRIDITQVDNGLSTIVFPKYQWKYPLLSFFHIQALKKMVNIQDYLNKRQLKVYLWRLSRFLPFLRHSQLIWILQQYYNIALRLNSKPRFQRFILRRCRKLINYYPEFKKNNYYLIRINLIQNERLMEVILDKNLSLQGFIEEQNEVLLSRIRRFAQDKIISLCRQKMESFHKNSLNLTTQIISMRCHRELLRLKIQQSFKE